MVPLVLLFGLFFLMAGSAYLVKIAFRESAGWGLVALLVPLGKLIFLLTHREESKPALKFMGFGIGILIATGCVSEDARERMSNAERLADWFTPKPSTSAKQLTAEIAQQREEIYQLSGQIAKTTAQLKQEYAALAKKRKNLKIKNQKEVAAFNVAAAAYTEKNQGLIRLHQRLATATSDLTNLLAERSELMPEAESSSASSSMSSAKVIMYGTRSCPACVAARSYFKQRGIEYDDRDVSSREFAEEFRQMGGNAVPVIIVGGQRMVGFSASELDRMIGS